MTKKLLKFLVVLIADLLWVLGAYYEPQVIIPLTGATFLWIGTKRVFY